MRLIKVVKRVVLGFMVMSLFGCAAMQTEFGKQNLDVQTRMTRTIFLEPVRPDQRTVYVQVKNTSGKNAFNLQHRLCKSISDKGYMIVSNPERAHYLVQANVLQISKVNLSEVNCAFDSGFGGALLGSTIVAVAGGDGRAVLGAGLAGAIIGIAADSMVKDNYYTIITDVQLGERATGLKETTFSSLAQGNSTRKIQASQKPEQWQKYQTRIISTANRSNLHLAEATPLLVDELVNSISGLM